MHLYWGPNSGSVQTTPDLYLAEAISAARRGVKVRILLSDSFLNPKEPRDNTQTVSYVNDLASKEGLDMEARLLSSKLVGLDKIHNKGVIVDGRKVLVSSINWSQNSPANNREVGLILEHPAVGAYFTDVFTYDWYNGTAADYPLITEADAVTGFVELTNFGPKSVSIGGWTLAATGGQWAIPAGTNLAPGKSLVLARDLKAYRDTYPQGAAPVILQGLTLAGAKDSLRLMHGTTQVDRLSWGGAEPGWRTPAAPLCRPVPGKDTNTALDWAPADHGTPGVAGCGT